MDLYLIIIIIIIIIVLIVLITIAGIITGVGMFDEQTVRNVFSVGTCSTRKPVCSFGMYLFAEATPSTTVKCVVCLFIDVNPICADYVSYICC